MGVHNHSRRKIVDETQHLYEHDLEDFTYSHPALPSSGSVASAMDYIFNILFPKVKSEYATPALLPTGVDTPTIGDLPPSVGDQRLVADDGDGNYAMYIFAKWDGDATAIWHKIADFDFGANSIVQGLLDQTQYLYPRKYGTTDYDQVTALPLAGDLAGQHFYGGDTSGQNLILHANNGDNAGIHTGSVFFDDDIAPLADLLFDLGKAGKRFNVGYMGTLVVGTATMTITSDGVQGSITDTNGIISFDDENLITTGNFNGSTITASTSLVVDNTVNQLTIGVGSITDSTGAISFGDENISTTGTLASGVTTVDGTLILATGSITDTSGAISFGNENLTTTGDINAAIATFNSLDVDDLNLNNNVLSISTLNTNLNLLANGTGVIDLQSAATTIGITTTGVINVTGSVVVDSITLDGTAVSVVGNVLTTPTMISEVDNARDLGLAGSRYRDLFLGNSIHDGTNNILVSDLMRLRNNVWRDAANTQPAQAGDTLFYDTVSQTWLASSAGGNNHYKTIHNEVALASPINVSADIDDARDCIWQLYEVITGDLLNVPIRAAATTVTILNTVPLPAGNYKLMGVEL